MDFVELITQLRALTKRHVAAGPRGTQSAVAKAAEIHPVTFTRFLAGDRGLSLEGAAKLADAIGYTLSLKPRGRSPSRPKPR